MEYDYPSLLDSFAASFIDRDARESFLISAKLDAIVNAFHQQQPLLTYDVLLRRPDGMRFLWYRFTVIAPIEGKISGTIQNVQAEKEAEFRLRHQAERDALTDLLNRAAFDRAVTERFAAGLSCGAFLILDIDDFKSINDTKGHQYGDEIITEIAKKLRNIMPDDALIGRFGGDEYVLFLSEAALDGDQIKFRNEIERLAKTITDASKGEDYSVSIGISLYPYDGGTISELLHSADRALYYVKHNGKDSYAFFLPSMPTTFEHSRLPMQRLLRMSRRVDWLRVATIATAVFVVILLLALLTNSYINSLQNMTREDSLDYLNEIAVQIDISTVKTLNSYSAQMRIIGSDLASLAPSMTREELSAFLQEKSELVGCDMIAAVDDESIWHTDEWSMKIMSLNEYLARCVLEQQLYMSEAVNVGGIDYVLIFVPVDLITLDYARIRTIAAFLRFDVMNEVLSLTAFDGAGHADILTTDGRVVVRSEHEDCILEGYNLFSALEGREFTDGSDLQELIACFATGQSGASRIVINGEENIFYYNKLGYQNWMLLASVPADVLEVRSQAFLRVTVYACVIIALIFCSLMAALAYNQARNKARLERLAYVDRITGCATREKFQLEAKRLLARRDYAYTMIYTNVDRFKAINDRLGTDGANGLLQHISDVLNGAVRSDEAVGRIDADHFGVLIATQDEQEITRRIRSWSRRISDYPPARQAVLTVSMSYGVYAVDDPALPIDQLLDRSNLARSARLKDRDSSPRIFFYDDELRTLLLREQLISDRMEAALADGSFRVYLQPQFAADTGRLVGYEALVRWQTERDGMLTPNSFIPVLERNGFIVKLDLYVFEQICILQKERLDRGLPVPRISFNVSRIHLNSDFLLSPYLTIWEKYQVPPACLEFEFTESVISDNPDRLWRVVESIHLHGFHCSMDDFGSGYSSLNMLHQTNVDVVKIDKSFLGSGAVPTIRSRAIIRAVVSLARELGMTTVAEGVEHAEQVAFLQEIGCDTIQGFYYAKPMPAEEALALMDD